MPQEYEVTMAGVEYQGNQMGNGKDSKVPNGSTKIRNDASHAYLGNDVSRKIGNDASHACSVNDGFTNSMESE